MATRVSSYVLLQIVTLWIFPTGSRAQLQWDPRFTAPGIHGYSAQLSLATDSSLIVTGLDFINGVCVEPAAVYRDGSWQPLGDDLPHYSINVVFTWRDELYGVGGSRDKEGIWHSGIARYLKNEWEFFIQGNGSLNALPTDSLLYVYGQFDSLNGEQMHSLAQWNGVKLEPVGLDLRWTQDQYAQERGVTSLDARDRWIYVTGFFTFTDSVTSHNILRFDRATHQTESIGTGTDKEIWGLEWWEGNLYAVGEFDAIGGTGAYRIARWDGRAWSAVGTPRDLIDCYRVRLRIFDGELLVYGGLTSAGRAQVSSIASWNGREWSAKYDRARRSISSLLVTGDKLIASFDSNGQQLELSTFGSGQWEAMTYPSASGMLGLMRNGAYGPVVQSLAATDDHLYVIGNFLCLSQSGDTIKNFARFDGDHWEAVLDTILEYPMLFAYQDRLFISDRTTLYELVDDTLRWISSFNSYISDIGFANNTIYVGFQYNSNGPSDDPTIITASLQDMQFNSTFADRNVRRISLIDDRLFYLSDDRLYEVSEGSQQVLFRASTEEYLLDLEPVGGSLYIAGRFLAPNGILTRWYLDAGGTVQPAQSTDTYNTARIVLKIGKDVFVSGSLGSNKGVYSTLARETDGVFTFLTDAVPSELSAIAAFKGDLYLASTDRIGSLQSSGIARAILTSSTVTRNAKPKTPANTVLVTGSSLRLRKPAFGLFDRLGRQIRSFTLESSTDVSDLPNGMYFVLYSDGERLSVHLIR